MKTAYALILACLASPAFAQEREGPQVCHVISEPDAFIRAASGKAGIWTIAQAEAFGKAAGYGLPLIAAFVLRDDTTLVIVGRRKDGSFSECFTSVHEDGQTWEAFQRFFGRQA
jgi:hypothetical protein